MTRNSSNFSTAYEFSPRGNSLRWRRSLLLLLLLSVFLFLRMRNLNHLLMWDEGRFLQVLKAFSDGDRASPFWQYIGFHPPLYLAISYLALRLGPSSSALSCQLVSLLSSLGILVTLYLIGTELFSQRIGFLASFLYALSPAASVLNLWIKEDSLCIFLSLLSIYLFIRKRFWLSGIFLGLAFLSKEFALLAALSLAFFAIASIRQKQLKMAFNGLIKVYAVAFSLSFWWYFFFYNSTSHWWGFLTGGNLESIRFHRAWTYYLTGLWADLGGITLILAILGLFASLLGFNQSKDERYLYPPLWMAASYLPLLFSYGKPYWLMIAALPSLTFLAAMGMDFLLTSVEKKGFGFKNLSLFLAVSLLASAFFIALYLNNRNYIESKGRGDYDYSLRSRATADYLDGVWQEGDRLLGIFEFAGMPNPVFLFYLNHPVDIIINQDIGLLPMQVAEERADWTFIVDTTYGDQARDELAKFYNIEPVRVGIGYIFNTYLLFEGPHGRNQAAER